MNKPEQQRGDVPLTDKRSKAQTQESGDDRQADYEATGEKRYQWPPVRDPDLSYKPKSRNPVQSILTALPVLMLVAGFAIYYLSESRQTSGAPIRAESISSSGIFTGLSATSDRHYLWIDKDGATQGVRIQSEDVAILEELVRGESIELSLAPRVAGSTTMWVWQVVQGGKTLLNRQDSLR